MQEESNCFDTNINTEHTTIDYEEDHFGQYILSREMYLPPNIIVSKNLKCEYRYEVKYLIDILNGKFFHNYFYKYLKHF